MGGLFGGGGGGGAPVAPKLKQVDTSLTGPLYQTSSAVGDEWANLMRKDYGFAPGGPAWREKLGQGAKAEQTQAELPFGGQQDPQVQGVERTGGFGNVNLGSNPYEVAQNLGQQFKNPLGQQNRNQNFLDSLLNLWKAPDTRLSGADLLNVKLGTAAQASQAQQAAFEAAQLAATSSAQQQGAASAAETGALASAGAGAIRGLTSPSLSASGYYQPSLLGSVFGGGGGAGDATAGASPEEFGATTGGTSMFGS